MTLVRLASAVLAVSIAAAAHAQTAPRRLTLDDYPRVLSLADPQRSPDGMWVAYTLTAIDAEKDKRNTDLWMARWDGSAQLQLTSSPDSETSPRWGTDHVDIRMSRRYDGVMRTTVRLDDGLLTKAKQEARRRGETLTSLMERGLRLAMARSTQRKRTGRVKLTVSTATGGLLPGVDLDDSKSIWDRLDGVG